jgi:aryl sulfotransferase
MSGQTVWLASYPKSGNTWMRAIVTALGEHPHLFAVNQLDSGAQPFGVGHALTRFGLDPRWLTRTEVDRVRTALISGGDSTEDFGRPLPDAGTDRRSDDDSAVGAPRLRKTHERYRTGAPGADLFPQVGTRAAILVVRDPRDVACSYAPFFGVDLDKAIEAMGSGGGDNKASPAQSRTAQPWGTWSEHTASWSDPDVPFDVHVVRFEDLRRDAVATLAPVFAAIGLQCTDDELATAVDSVRFERLQESERQSGFREVSPKTDQFFRSGRAGGWRDELTGAQEAAIESDHGDMMQHLGYELVTSHAQRLALGQSRASQRRRSTRRWSDLPAWLGLEVTEGPVPAELVGADRPRTWLQATATATRVQFGDGNALLVEDGTKVTVQWNLTAEDSDTSADLSWLVQGWAVTLASMQRGNLSLHASTVRIGGEVVAIAGQQGAGKSTTSMALRRRGHELLVDDTTIIDFADGAAWVTPYPRNVHLLPDAAAALGVDFDALAPLAGRLGKVAFTPEDPPPHPHRIDRIVVLTTTADAEHVSLHELRGAQRLEALTAHVSRRGLAPVILGPTGFFERLARLAGSTRIQMIKRPPDQWTLDDVLDAIEGGNTPVEGHDT